MTVVTTRLIMEAPSKAKKAATALLTHEPNVCLVVRKPLLLEYDCLNRVRTKCNKRLALLMNLGQIRLRDVALKDKNCIRLLVRNGRLVAESPRLMCLAVFGERGPCVNKLLRSTCCRLQLDDEDKDTAMALARLALCQPS